MEVVDRALEQYSVDGASKYYEHKSHQKWRQIEERSLINAMKESVDGGLVGKRVCDLGCGNGFYSRQCLDLGASFVAGFDLSPTMIEQAAADVQNPDREAYHQANLLEMVIGEEFYQQFDVALVAFLWNYASNIAFLKRFVEQTAAFLKPGGKVFLLTDNKKSIEDYKPLNKYGMYREPNLLPQHLDSDGFAFDYLFGTPESNHRLTNYRMSLETTERVASSAKLVNMHSHPLLLPEDFKLESDFWHDFLQLEPIALYSFDKL